MSCHDSSPRPGKLYAETEIQSAVNCNCGINTSQHSKQVVKITNLGGSPTDVFIQARSRNQRFSFPSSQSTYKACYGVPIRSGNTVTVRLVIMQDSPPSPVYSTDEMIIKILFRNQPSQLQSKNERKSLPNNLIPAGTLESQLTLTDP